MNRNWTSILVSASAIIAAVAGFFTFVVAYLIHVVWTVTMAMNEQLDTVSEWFLALIGLFMPPIGIIHGFVIWFL